MGGSVNYFGKTDQEIADAQSAATSRSITIGGSGIGRVAPEPVPQTATVDEYFRNIPTQPVLGTETATAIVGGFFRSNGNVLNSSGVYRINENNSYWGTNTSVTLLDTGITTSTTSTPLSVNSGLTMGALELYTFSDSSFRPSFDVFVRGTRDATKNATYNVTSLGGQTILSTHTGRYFLFNGIISYFWPTLRLNPTVQPITSGPGLFTWGANATDPINAENRENF